MKFILFTLISLCVATAQAAVTTRPCSDPQAYRLAEQAQVKATRFYHDGVRVVAVGIGVCEPFWAATVLGNAHPAVMRLPTCGVKLHFTSVSAMKYVATASHGVVTLDDGTKVYLCGNVHSGPIKPSRN
jgi:hypothetical protein